MKLIFVNYFLAEQDNVFQTKKTISLIELIVSSGFAGQIIIGLLFILLLIGLYIYFERLFTIKSAVKIDKTFMNEIKTFVTSGKIEMAQTRCLKEEFPAATLISKGISRIGRPLEDINSAIENAGRLEIYKLEKNISVLATISGASPMIGFLGTVIGMIISIFEISNAEEVLTWSFFQMDFILLWQPQLRDLLLELLVHLYNHLVVKISKVVYQMQASSLEFLIYLTNQWVNGF